jgi:hypothetical protein
MLRRKQLRRNVQSLTHWLRALGNELNFPEDIFSCKIVLKYWKRGIVRDTKAKKERVEGRVGVHTKRVAVT